MPSTVVHLALAGLIAAGLLGSAFSVRALAVVFLAVIFADLDVFVSLLFPGTHRAAFHTLLIPLGVAALLAYDTRVREESWLRDRFGTDGPRVAWVSVVAFAFAAVGLDLFTGNANLFYPLHDQFYRIEGKAIFTNQQGFVQTFVELDGASVEAKTLGSTKEVHVNSGVDPTRGAEPKNVRRVFPVAQAGWQLLLVLTSLVVVGGRLREQ